ncbi:MAG: hypothetical protein JWN69_2458 [Alphaproteobacteria bacterium]|nr:hypothetical protein [Alphaproteobacteria bacterium]
MTRSGVLKLFAAACLAGANPASAQITPVDPNSPPSAGPSAPYEAPAAVDYEAVDAGSQDPAASVPTAPTSPAASAQAGAALAPPSDTIPKRDVIGAAENVFGKGAKGLGEMLEKVLADQGEPTAYIAGREASGAIVFGVRYGSGTMRHKIEGDRAVYWTGPSVGFDVGGDANKVFVLVYNLHDSQELFRRYPSAEGHAYFIGGFAASYLRRGQVVLIPIRLGVGARLGINAGYMAFSEKSRWLPF